MSTVIAVIEFLSLGSVVIICLCALCADRRDRLKDEKEDRHAP